MQSALHSWALAISDLSASLTGMKERFESMHREIDLLRSWLLLQLKCGCDAGWGGEERTVEE